MTTYSDLARNLFRYANAFFIRLCLASSVMITFYATAQSDTAGTSQKFSGQDAISVTLRQVLPSISYTTNNLSQTAKRVNSSVWHANRAMTQDVGTRVQALLNWHGHGVGAVDGIWGKNSLKAMQAFQQANGLDVTESLDEPTWQLLATDKSLFKQPVLVTYTLTEEDVNLPLTIIPEEPQAKGKLEGMYYESVLEGLAEKFHMDQEYLQSLNPDANFEVGEKLTVYNPGTPSAVQVTKVVADKVTQTVYAYDTSDNMVASYPSTVGSSSTPSPEGIYRVKVKVHQPNYTYTHDDGSKTIIPSGPNNPVGVVWIGLTKPTYGIHGSPEPERISRQASAGCIRLTNWDALALYGTISRDAVVEFR